jgi:hypothetical protein
MPRPLVYVDTSNLREGALAELRAAFTTLAGPRFEITGRAFAMNGDRIGLIAAREDVSYLAPNDGAWTPEELADRVPGWVGEQPPSLIVCP